MSRGLLGIQSVFGLQREELKRNPNVYFIKECDKLKNVFGQFTVIVTHND